MARANFRKVDRAFYKTREFANIVRVGAAAFRPKLMGGFRRMISELQGAWPDLSPGYAAQKARRGQDLRKWVRTGRTLKALSQGPIMKEGTRKGVRFKITPGRLIARLSIRTFGPARGKRPPATVQKKIFRNLNYGFGRRVAGGFEFAGKGGRKEVRSRGIPRRLLFVWRRSDVSDVEKSVAEEAQLIARESGF